MTIKANRDCGCGNDAPNVQRLRGNALQGSRREIFLGQEHLVVPLVMLRQTVVNGAFVQLGELAPEGWNGAPVTIGHPEVNGVSVTANTPTVLQKWRVGQIFNARLDGDKLKAEAWINVAQAEAFRSGIIALLEGGQQMDVSTGYFSTDEKKSGTFNGKQYNAVSYDLKPDHLALLPDEEGACSWADGCGVRVNNKELSLDNKDANPDVQELAMFSRFVNFLKPSGHNNRRASDDDRMQMVADLISSDSTPFIPADMYSLQDMDLETLKNVKATYMPAPATNSQGDPDMADETKTDTAKPLTADEITAIVVNALTAALPTAVNSAVDEALNATKRVELIDAIHTNTKVDKAELEKLSTNALEAMAPAKVHKADFSGRGIKQNADAGGDDKLYVGMVTNGRVETAAKKEA